MSFLKALIANKAWVAHLLGLASLTGAEAASGTTNPILLGAITVLTSVFHVCETIKQVNTPQISVAVPPTTTAIGSEAVLDAATDVRNAAGDTQVEA